VVAVVGKPDRTRQIGDDPTWYYDGKVFDPVNGKITGA
jgi:hypothetical protein